MKDDREFWLQVRRGLLMVVAAIETRWSFPRTTGPSAVATLGQSPPASTEDHPSTPSIEPPR